jgi:exosome complex component RRP45
MAMGAMRMSINEKQFIEAALRENQRIDGRTPFDFRRLVINFSKDDSAEVQLGQTRVLAVVSAQLVQPYPDRPNEGTLAIFTEFSPMADPGFEPGRPGEMAVELGRIIDRGLRYVPISQLKCFQNFTASSRMGFQGIVV